MKVAAVLALITLAGCGADGDPIRPTLNTTISAGSGGVHTSTSVGVKSGPVAVSVGL
ncbi:hypothetical protein [Primorskyibacter sedentarius]|uniref:hypothetical protein n=1 Tax=Primorskyibacter sedentarius TaxID=745311 RepID=UPI003EB6BC3D